MKIDYDSLSLGEMYSIYFDSSLEIFVRMWPVLIIGLVLVIVLNIYWSRK